jgi:tetratricopeptide (TPR) repeat protein
MKWIFKYVLVLILTLLALNIEAEAQTGKIPPASSDSVAIATVDTTKPESVSLQNKPQVVEKPMTEKEMVEVAAKGVDRAINVLGLILKILGIWMTLVAIALTLGGIYGFFEVRRWREIRKQALDSLEEVKKCAEDAKPILERIKRTEKEVNERRDKIKLKPLTETPTEEEKKLLDKQAKDLGFLEKVGSPLNAEDYFNLAMDLYYKGKVEEAIHYWEEAIRIKPDDAEAWNNKGVALGNLGKREEAIKCYDEAIKIKPDYAEAWSNKGMALVNLGKQEEAIKCYDDAIKIKPDDAGAHFNKACAYSKMQDKANMLKFLAKAIELDPSEKQKARTDEDFQAYWEDEDFKKLVE